MKIRNGFVSNSSSSSFICAVCGGVESGWDASLSDVGMMQCLNEHIFHESCQGECTPATVEQQKAAAIEIVKRHFYDKKKTAEALAELEALVDDKLTKKALEALNEKYEIEQFGECALDTVCPLCSLTKVSYNDAMAYLVRKTMGSSTAEVVKVLRQEIKDTFKSYDELCRFIAGKE